jgi:polysaccharide biosynthesis protein PslJ
MDAVSPAPLSGAVHRDQRPVARTPRPTLPTRPLVALFGFYPVWWALGVVDVIWIPFAISMGYYLLRRGAVRAPLAFGLWLLFLMWAGFSVVELDGGTLAFIYRYFIYAACTVILLYVYNARETLTERFVSGVMTVFWLTTVAGGYLGLAFPTGIFHTPLSRFLSIQQVRDRLPGSLLSNDLLQHMVVRHFSQFNPGAYNVIDPRPSAPFLYTNNWGNAYSLLIPFVIIYMLHVRRERKLLLLVIALMLSVIPAFLTLNRGMFLGLAVAVIYAAGRLALRGNMRGIALLLLATLGAAVAFTVLPIQDRIQQRESGSTTTRAGLYQDALGSISSSPILGFGGPRASNDPYAPPVGTQGQFWLVLYSNGIVGALLFVGWFAAAFVITIKRPDPAGIAWNTILLVAIVEQLYYGFLPSGLPIIMVAAALAFRGPERVRRSLPRRAI